MKKVLGLLVLTILVLTISACEIPIVKVQPPVPVDVSQYVSATMEKGLQIRINIQRENIQEVLGITELRYSPEMKAIDVITVFVYNMQGQLVAYGNAKIGNLIPKEEV